ncbi:MAG: hypothetical protein K9G33_02340 [Sneathiella sp.]|nr:hypothetical protein [Sneathiella sp.]
MTDEFTPQISNRLLEFIRFDEVRKAKELEEARALVTTSSVPLPDYILERVLRLSPTNADVVLREHNGFILSERREHYRASLSIMVLSIDNLSASLLNFEKLATTGTIEIIKRKNRSRLEAIERQIQKELFCVANAAASLVDHTRRLNSEFHFREYNGKLQECFGDDGLHDLVISLRVLLHHLHIVKAGWSIRSNFATGTRTAHFQIDRSELQRAIDQAGDRFQGKKYVPMLRLVDGWPEGINLIELFGEYQNRLEKFHSWLEAQINDAPPEALQDYDRCILEKNRRSTRMGWNVLIGNWLNWERVPNIHKHLPDYLQPEQLEAVYSRPRNSKEQVELIIEYLDDFGAVNEEFRESVYRLFDKLATQEADDQP